MKILCLILLLFATACSKPENASISMGESSVSDSSNISDDNSNDNSNNTVVDLAVKFVIIDPIDSEISNQVTVTIEAQDSSNSLVSDYSGTVTLVADGSATGGGIVTLVNGTGSLNITDASSETVNLSLIDSNASGFDITSIQNVLFYLAASKFVIINPTDVGTSSNSTVLVEAQDTNGTKVTDYSGSVTLVTDGSATGGGVVAITNGSGSLNITDATDGTVNLSLVDSNTTGFDISSTQDLIFYLVATKFVIINPTDVAAGLSSPVLIEAQDTNSSKVTNYSGSVTLVADGSTTGAGVVTITNGSGSLAITSTVGETVNLSLTDSATTGLTVSSTQDVIFSVTATHFVIMNPSNTQTDNSSAVTIQAQNGSGGLDTGYSGGVTIVASGSATGDGLVTLTNGVGTINISDSVAETVNLSLTDSQSTGFDVSSTGSIIYSAALYSYKIIAPYGVEDTNTYSIYVEVQDVNGDVVTAEQDDVTLVEDGSINRVIDIINGVGKLTALTMNATTEYVYTLSDSAATGYDFQDTKTVKKTGDISLVTLDSTGGVDIESTTSTVAGVTSCSGCIIIASVHIEGIATTSTMTFNGEAFTKLEEVSYSGVAERGTSIWYLKPSSAVASSIITTISTSTAFRVNYVQYENVNDVFLSSSTTGIGAIPLLDGLRSSNAVKFVNAYSVQSGNSLSVSSNETEHTSTIHWGTVAKLRTWTPVWDHSTEGAYPTTDGEFRFSAPSDYTAICIGLTAN